MTQFEIKHDTYSVRRIICKQGENTAIARATSYGSSYSVHCEFLWDANVAFEVDSIEHIRKLHVLLGCLLKAIEEDERDITWR